MVIDEIKKAVVTNNYGFFVPTTRFELAHLAELPPQSSVSTNFTTWALRWQI